MVHLKKEQRMTASPTLVRRARPVPTPEPARRARAQPAISERLNAAGYLFLAVAVVLLVPFGVTVYRSVFSDGVHETFNGATNYEQIYRDPVLGRALLNTLF